MLNRCLAFVGGVLLVFLALSGSAQAQQQVPEVDPGSMVTALALLAASGALVADSVRRKIKAR